jgi:ribonuclease P protein component
MLPKSQRLLTDRQFQKVFRHSRPRRGAFLTARSIVNDRPTHRFGFVVGGIVSKKAVVRNLIKRRLRAIARQMPSPPPAYDLVLIAQRSATQASFQQLTKEFHQLWPRQTA